ncbi:BatD family protein [Nannocystis bainbridge]|uniref:BatD family protein n=1 Tax=Nannocystis bainbridge TaxID=2995303 RepID=A0ABT5E736_9BACT|nr:BatD family protein [Nannocystis bainbridge]MDC0720586.1 BatD family protein [Nannocystis bainbridge]
MQLAGAAGLGLYLSPRTARADTKSRIVAEIDRERVEVGEAFELTVQVDSEGERGAEVPEPVLPDMTALGLQIVGMPANYRSTSSSFSFGTGRGSTMTTRTTQTSVYTLIASKPGRIELPVHILEGKTKVTPPRIPAIEVTGQAAPTEPVPAAADGPTEPQGDIFLWTRLDKPTLFVGEQLTYTLEIYERLPFLQIQLRQLPGFQDFWSEELPQGQMRQAVVGNTAYRVHPGLRRALFPQRAGTLTLSPAEVGIGMRRRITGRPVTVEVKPLPAGAPAGFSPNNVGVYSIRAEADRTNIKVGEPFTLTVAIQGTGNIRVIDPGAWPEMPGLRRYEPKIETDVTTGAQLGGERRYAFLVIPERGGTLTVPPHTFHYFDPASESYQTATSAPIELTVAGDPNAAPTLASDAPPPAAAEEEGILAPIVEPAALPRATPSPSWLTPSRWAWAMAGAPVLLALGTAASALWRRLGPDEHSRAAAARAAKQRELLAQAERGLGTGEGFYPALAQLLQAAAIDRAGPEGEGLPRHALLALLAGKGVSSADCERLRDLLDRCDAARFGARGESASEREVALQAARELLHSSAALKPGSPARPPS